MSANDRRDPRGTLPRTDAAGAPDEAGREPGSTALDAVRALARPRARGEFRTRLRHEFTSGRIGERRGLARPSPWFQRGALLLPLAAGFLLVVGVVLNRGPDWRVLGSPADSASAAARLSVDGVEIAPGDGAALAQRLKRGGHVRIEGAMTLDLVAPGVAAVALAPGTDLVLSASPGRWWGRGMRARLAEGDVYFTTGRAFRGAHLDVSTPEVSTRAVGTAFAVLRGPDFTCVCVQEGHVRVAGAREPLAAGVDVPQGMRRVMHADGRSEFQPILIESVHRLHLQRTAAAELIGR